MTRTAIAAAATYTGFTWDLRARDIRLRARSVAFSSRRYQSCGLDLELMRKRRSLPIIYMLRKAWSYGPFRLTAKFVMTDS